MNDQKAISRREFLKMSALAAAGIAVVACAQKTEAPPEPEVAEATATPAPAKEQPTPTPKPEEPKEHPFQVADVAAGKIPPLDERMPAEPMVIDRTGKYGETCRIATTWASLNSWEVRFVGNWFGTPLRLSEDLQGVVPNVWKGFDFTDGFTVLTGYLRPGLKWNDGEPHTADDWLFWFEDTIKNEDITPTPDNAFKVGDKLMDFEKLDDYTIRFTFHAPNPSFPMVNLGHEYAFWSDNALPRHYLSQFHINYNPKAEDDAKAAGHEFWYQLFGEKRSPDNNLEVPRMSPYKGETSTPEGATFVRNPYYWMADAEGNQLGYFDGIYQDYMEDGAVIEARMLAGELDFLSGWKTQVPNYQTYKENEEAGNYRTLAWSTGFGTAMLFQFNMNYEDDVWRELFSDKRWRQALSVAINRDEINEVVFFGLGVPGQLTAHSSSRAYNPEFHQAWAQYDPDLANQMLDEIGLEWDADHNLRLLPDGRPIQIVYDSHSDSPIQEMVFEYWRELGIQVDFKTITRTLLRPKIQGNQEMMSDWAGDEVLDTLLLRRPKWFAPIYGDESTWAPMWGLWYNTDGKEGFEPPDEIKQLYEWHDKYMETDDVEWANKILASQAENIWSIGTVGDTPSLMLVNNDLKGMPDTGVWSWDNIGAYELYPEGWYFDR